MGGLLKYAPYIFYLFIIIFSIGNGKALYSIEFTVNTSVPLGMAYDGRVLWIADQRTKNLYGYDVQDKRPIREVAIRIQGLRDIDFRYPHLITVYPNYLAVIDPITGNVVDRHILSSLDDPVSICLNAHDTDVAYIFNRSDSRVYRYHLKQKNFQGSFALQIKNPRAMTFYRNSLWVSDKGGRLNRVDPKNGEIISFLNLPPDSYGVSFLSGILHVSRPGNVQTVDFIETDNYVASNRKVFNFRGKISLRAPWSQKQRKQEPALGIHFTSFPFSPRQRYRRIQSVAHKGKNPLRFRRDRAGNAKGIASFDKNETTIDHQISVSFTVFDLTYIVNSQNRKQFFNRAPLTKELLQYIENIEMDSKLEKKFRPFLREWSKKEDARHPIELEPLFQKSGITNLFEKVYLARQAGIPARRVMVYSVSKKKYLVLFQFYAAPLGWLTISPEYNVQKPQEFPLGNDYIELYILDDIKIKPTPKSNKNENIKQNEQLINWAEIVVIDASKDGSP